MTPEASILGILLKEAGASRRNGRMSGVVKQGRWVDCHFALCIVLQYLGVPNYPDAGKNSTKRVTVTPLFVCVPQALVKKPGLESRFSKC